MKLEILKNCMKIVPESAVDHAYLELNYGMTKWNDSIVGTYKPNNDVFLKNAIEFKRTNKGE